MKYIRIFDTHQDYQNYRKQVDFLEPNMSLCEDHNMVHFTKYEPKAVAKFNITDTSSATVISASGMDSIAKEAFKQIEVDGVVLAAPVAIYQFTTTGEHVVRYTTYSGPVIGANAFSQAEKMTEVTIPDTVNMILPQAFDGCTGLTDVTIGSGLMSIDFNAFKNTPNVESFTVLSTIPPMLSNTDSIPMDALNNGKCTIYVPAESVDTYKTTGLWANDAIKDHIQAIPSA